jgi:predicted secreted hydrolase
LTLAFEVIPTVADQELVTTETTGLTYWEGQVEVRGRRGEAGLEGLGYVELTGYAGHRPERASAGRRFP